MILYNGSSGSLGAYFAKAAEARGVTAIALQSRLESRDDLRNELASIGTVPRVVFVQMAAKVSVPQCEADPEGAAKTNVVDTAATVSDVNGWAKERGMRAAVVYVSTGHVYATQEAGTAANESHPLAPRSVYARTKLEGEEAVGAVLRGTGSPLVVARVFGLMAPVQPANYLLPGLIRRVAEDRLVGIPGLSYVRDYLDARDVCEILVDLALREDVPAEVFNVCSGRPVHLRSVLEEVLRAMKPDEAVRLMGGATEAAARPDDIPWIVGSPAKLASVLGRELQCISLANTVRDAVCRFTG